MLDMSRKFKTNLKTIVPSPQENPLVEPQSIETKRRYVTSGRADKLISASTGEYIGSSVIRTIEERDDAEFVKVFAGGVAASYELSKTAQRVFQVVLNQYQKTPMSRGYADCVNLYWFGDGLDGESIGMSKYTFNRGLRELLDKKFLYPKDTVAYWVNPALFFKGDRVTFVKEYRKKKAENEKNSITKKSEEEINSFLKEAQVLCPPDQLQKD